MEKIKIHVLHTGKVCIAPSLAFGGEHCNLLKASGIFCKKSERIWLPVSVYLIEHPKGNILVDCGWHRSLSPEGIYDKKAQIRSLRSPLLYLINQGVLPEGQAVDEQLRKMNLSTNDIDYVLLTHLDCDHANGLAQVAGAKHILAAEEEIRFANKHSLVRYQKKWWKNVPLTAFRWNGTEGPASKSYDLFGDGSVVLIHIPGHSDGLFAVKIRNANGKFVLLCSDGGYAQKSWTEMITSGISSDKKMQRSSLAWIRSENANPDCIRCFANHDPDVEPQVIELS